MNENNKIQGNEDGGNVNSAFELEPTDTAKKETNTTSREPKTKGMYQDRPDTVYCL